MSVQIIYSDTIIPDYQQIIELYESSGLKRPTHDAERIKKMYANSDLIITAWDGNLLVGVSRALTDYSYSCYLSDLAVRQGYKQQGIGKTLVAKTKELAGPQSMLLLVASQVALNYYPKIGLQPATNAYWLKREE